MSIQCVPISGCGAIDIYAPQRIIDTKHQKTAHGGGKDARMILEWFPFLRDLESEDEQNKAKLRKSPQGHASRQAAVKRVSRKSRR